MIINQDQPHSNSPESTLKHKLSSGSSKLTLPPIKWKGKSDPHHCDSNRSALQIENTNKIDYLRKKSGEMAGKSHGGILKSVFSLNSIKKANEIKKVTFIDEVINKPIAEYECLDGYVYIKKRKKPCSCAII